MWSSFGRLSERDRAACRATMAFINDRLDERATIDWALHLGRDEVVKRAAIRDLLDSLSGKKLGEPWRSAWRLIEESWDSPPVESGTSRGVYQAQSRLRKGDRSGALVAAIVELVTPRLEIEPLSQQQIDFQKPAKRPRTVNDLFSTRLTSGEVVDPDLLDLRKLTDRSFLLSLAHALDTAVIAGLDIARRIGWDGERRFWLLGQLHRVYYVVAAKRAPGEHEPDEFHRGIAPSVKLLHAVILRLVDIDIAVATEFVRRWRLANSSVHLRLWAALSCDPRVTAATEVGPLLISLDDRRFWNLHGYPEIAELRAKRFVELSSHEHATLAARIRKLPPRGQWPRKADAALVERGRLYWAVRELKRIEIAGGVLPQRDKAWLGSRIGQFPELVQMSRLDEGFVGSAQARWVQPNPDSRYDLLAGEERLKALEAALSSARRGWVDDPGERAADWIRQQGNPAQVLTDFEITPDGGAAFARVWDSFGWAHSPAREQGAVAAQRDLQMEAARVLMLLAKLPESTVRQALQGICYWLDVWKTQVVSSPEGLKVWFKVWPTAVEATNAMQPAENAADLNTVARSSDDREPMDLDTLNTPVGKLVGVFLAACPNLQANSRPFDADGAPGAMRETTIMALGRSGLIARHRMIEELPYFLRADPDWTIQHLTAPLMTDGPDAIALWRAIGRRTHI